MSLSPKIIGFLLAIFITVITVTFLSFVPDVNKSMLFVASVACFFSSFYIIFYVVDVLIFQEIQIINEAIKQFEVEEEFSTKPKKQKNANPIKQLNQELAVYAISKQKEIEDLKQAEQFRREFLADVSHELKTPIFAAQGFVHTLIDGAADNPAVRDRFLAKAAKSLDGLDVLVRDLVILSQIESGVLKMNVKPLDILQLTQEVCEQLEPKMQERGIVFKLKIKKNTDSVILGDQNRIRQVLTNLIENAIKYGHENGNILITFTEEKKNLLVAIKDDGEGITPEHLSRIFERFYRIDKSRSRETGGSGLGLAIVKHILSGHNSGIKVVSQIGVGTTFSFELEKVNPSKPKTRFEELKEN